MRKNNDIYRTILNSIYKECWIEIKYQNKDEIIKNFWISIIDIDFDNKKLECNSLSLSEDKYKTKKISIFLENILEAEILENTKFENKEKLIIKLEKNINKTKTLFPCYEYEKILLYLEECVKYDTIPFKTEIETIWGIDKDVLADKLQYKLNEEQTIKLKKYMANPKNRASNYKQLGINLLSIIYPNNKQYVLVYLPVKWNIMNNTLERIQGKPIFNPKFSDVNHEKVEEWQISEYLTEDHQELLIDYEKNHKRIHDILVAKFSNTKKYISDTAKLLFIERNKSIDLEKEYQGIQEMYLTGNVTKPISYFFGELEANAQKFKERGFCFINNSLNISQINSIFLAFKEDVSLVQGPPGTGKTSTVINAVTTAFYNKKKILVVTNNNKPMKDLKSKFDNLGFYKKELIELPVCRLSAIDKMDETIISMNKLYYKYKNANVNDEILEKNSLYQSENLKEIIKEMNDIDNYVNQERRRKYANNFIETIGNDFVRLSILLQSNNKYKFNKIIDERKINEKVNMNENVIKSFLYFYSAKCLQKLDDPTYCELKSIIDIDINNQESLKYSVEKFISFISSNDGLELLLDVFPIVLSTNISANKLADPKPFFDICIIDEAGQCNIATSLIPIIRAKKLMLVGDIQQLKPVIILNPITNDKLKEQYDIKESFCYINNSIYSAFKENAPTQKESLLAKHYRCNNKIISFCNSKYYQNKLIISSISKCNSPLEFTNVNDEEIFSQKNTSLNEVKEVIKILQREDIKNKSVGIITPYVVQKKLLEQEVKRQIKNVKFDIGTIHTFQGDEKEVIIFSTAISNNTTIGTYNWLKSNKQLINVAVSRAIDKFIFLGNENALKQLHNKTIHYQIDDIYELYEYITRNGKSVITPNSIKCEALGTEEGSILDKDMITKLALALSTIDEKTKYKEKVKHLELLGEKAGSGTFDFVIYNNLKIIAIQVVKIFQKIESYDYINKLCKDKNIDLITIESNQIRSYYSIKELLKEELKKKR